MEEKLEIPEGVSVSWEPPILRVSGPKGKVEVPLKIFGLEVISSEGAVLLRHPELKFLRTAKALVKNAFFGVKEGYWKKLKIRYSHFPIKVEISGDQVLIKNFFGERGVRRARILPPATVKVSKDEILVEGPDKYAVGQTAANIREATKLHGRRKKDFRIFQDGIYVSDVSEGFR